MKNAYYTVDQVSELLGIHPKTTRRYILEGRLKAGKIGKAYRISGHDLSVFTESRGITLPVRSAPTPRRGIRISAVVDVPVADTYEAERIESLVLAAANSKDSSYGRSTVNVQRIEDGTTLRVMIWGSAPFAETMVNCIRMANDANT